MGKRKCEKCGQEINEFAIVCDNCGSRIMPIKPKFHGSDLIVYAVLIIIDIVCIFTLPYLLSILGFIVATAILAIVIKVEFEVRHKYKLAVTDFEAYTDYVNELKEKSERHAQKQRESADKYLKELEEERAKLPPCPICHTKYHVKRIGTFNRAASTTAWGLGSAKIGKQYECTHCKHYF